MKLQADILAKLQQDILLMQGFKPAKETESNNGGLGIIKTSFPNNSFPLAAMHEFFCNTPEDNSATSGFISGILSSVMCKGGAAVWIAKAPMIFPPALNQFGVDPSKVIFIHLKNDKDILFVTEEALKCEGFTAVVADIKELGFTESRRFQLAVEQTNVTGFIIRNKPKNISTASVTRWKITTIESDRYEDLPGLSFPRWNVELLKVRNGKPGKWIMEWNDGKFNLVAKPDAMVIQPLRKVV